MGTSSVYLQVTATPQALFLQSLASDEKPKFIHYFDPGSKYLGGEFFFGREDSVTHRPISEADLELLLKGQGASPGLLSALATFVCVVAYFKFKGRENANCLIHPHFSRSSHQIVFETVSKALQEMCQTNPSETTQELLTKAFLDLMERCSTPMEIEDFWRIHRGGISIQTVLINADNKVSEDEYKSDFNVIVGANAIGRGVAFPHLQVVYYTRQAKTPQADTFWQHSRIFGYDRDWEVLRIFMPPTLFRLFRNLQDQNSRLIEMIRRGEDEILQIPLPRGIAATRSNVIDRKRYRFVVGGTNYFPPNPNQGNALEMDRLFDSFKDANFTGPVDIEVVKKAILLASDSDVDWKAKSFVKAIELELRDPKATLLLRRGRAISANTGSMLSPNDRQFGDGLDNQVVLTAYRVFGEAGGWSAKQDFWLVNVKLPGKLFYHEME
jgi:hypothetical protein